MTEYFLKMTILQATITTQSAKVIDRLRKIDIYN